MSAKTLSAAEWRRRLLATCQRMIDSADRLCQADRDLGDGDHGVTMARAFAAAQTAYGAAPASPGPDLAILGAKLMGAGGTSGIVFGTWFSSAAKAIGAKEIDGRTLAEAMAEAAQAVRNRAKASPGDKTMIDALLPAVEALRAAADEGPDAALRKAASAAWGSSTPARSRSPSSSRGLRRRRRPIGNGRGGPSDAGEIGRARGGGPQRGGAPRRRPSERQPAADQRQRAGEDRPQDPVGHLRSERAADGDAGQRADQQ